MLSKMFKKYSCLSAPAKAAIWFTICNFVLKGISFITVPLFTRLLPSDEYGLLSVFTSYEQVILILATWEIQHGAYQKGIFKYKDNVEQFTSSTQALVNILTLGFFLLVLIFNRFVIGFTNMNGWILLLLFVYLIFQPSYTAWIIRCRTKYDYKKAVTVTIAYTLVNVIIPLAAILLFQKTANYKFGATLIGSSIFCLFFYIKNADYRQLKGKTEQVKEYWKFLIAFEGPVVLHSLSYLILNQADRVMISKMVGNSEAAFYSVAYSLAVVINILQSSINQSLLPWRYQMLEQKNYEKIKSVTHSLLIMFAVAILMYILVAPELVHFLFREDYWEAIWCIPPVASSIFFMFLYTIFVNIESYYEKTKYIMYVSVTCGLVNIVLNYICIKIFGYIACGYTTLASYILFAFGHYYFMKKILKENDVKENVVNPQIVFTIGFSVVLVSIVFTLLYNVPVARYAILILAAGVIFLNRKRIINLFSTMKKRA